MHIKDKILHGHIYEESKYLFLNSKNIHYEDFLRDETQKRAFAHSIEIIGEASKKLSTEFRNSHKQINWRAIAGMRDKLIHDYFGVDYELVWNVATVKTKELIDFIDKLDIDIITLDNPNQ
jgi:uncharacterized protein with HEPN domain